MNLSSILLDTGAIADIANVTPAAVSNWRKRHEDFPTPAITSGRSPLYAADQIQRWLVEQGRLEGPIPKRYLVAPILDRFSATLRDDAGMPPAAITDIATVCALFVARANEEPDNEWPLWDSADVGQRFGLLQAGATTATEDLHLEEELFSLTQLSSKRARTAAVELVEAIRGWHTTGSDDSPFHALEQLLENYRADRDKYGALTTPRWLRKLLIEITPTARNSLIVDPACGNGSLLRQAVAATPDSRGHGVDINVSATQRATIWNTILSANVTVEAANSLDPDAVDLTGDVILAVPPMGLADWGNADIYLSDYWELGRVSKRTGGSAWLQRAWKSLAAGGRAAVITEPSLMWDQRSADVRRALLERTAIEAVIELPAGTFAAASVSPVLWLLTRDPSDRPPLLIDATGLGTRKRSAATISPEDLTPIIDAVTAWREGCALPESDLRAFPLIEVGDDVNLTPRAHAPTELRDVDQILRDLAATDLSSTRLPDVLPSIDAISQWPTMSGSIPVSLDGVASVLRGSVPSGQDDDATPVGWRDLIDGEFSDLDRSEGHRTIHVGDLLIPEILRDTANSLPIVEATAEHAGLTPQRSVIMIRPKDQGSATARWLKLWLSSPAGYQAVAALTRGTTIQRISTGDLQSLKVPIPAKDLLEQATAAVQELTAQATQLADTSAALRSQAHLVTELAAALAAQE